MTEWTVWEGILDTFADDGESIVQVENWLKYLGIKADRDDIKQSLIQVLNQELIRIAYPTGRTKEDFINCDEINIEDFWFEMKHEGCAEWDKN